MDELNKPTKKSTSDAAYYRFATRIMGDFGVSIAVPLVVAVFVGIWLDRSLNTVPYFMFSGLVVAAGFTYFSIKKKAKIYADEFDNLNKNSQPPISKKDS